MRPARLVFASLALIPAIASAAPVDDAADPALDDATSFDFDGVTDINASGFATPVGDVLVTVEVDASAPSVLECFEPEANTGCRLVSYQDTPVTITFDPPVSAVGLTMSYSVGPFSATFEGESGQELVTDATSGWQHPDSVFVGAKELGPISSVTLDAGDYATYWDDLTIATGTATAPADLRLSLSPARAELGANASWPIEVTLDNAGPSDATQARAMMLVPRGANIDALPEGGIPTAGGAFYEYGDLANGATGASLAPLTTPSLGDFSCEDTIVAIGVAQHDGGDPNPANNIAIASATFDRSSAPTTESCDDFVDRDCDGLIGCFDPDCSDNPACEIPPSLAGRLPFPPTLPIVPVGEPDPLDAFPDPFELPDAPPRCENTNLHGELVERPAICCAPRPCASCTDPSLADWLNTCPPLDPNFKEADPPVNGLGFGTTAAGQRISYAITYENIGGSPAHDVSIVDVLDADLDDSTLELEGAATYDPVTRGILWVDDELPPMEPRTVRYSIEVRDDAPLGTQVRNHAIIVFPDAAPPSAIATNVVVHSIPFPDEGGTAQPDLRIDGCVDRGDGTFDVLVENHSLAFVYNAEATILDAPEGFIVGDDTCAFAHPSDPEPDAIATIVPWAITRSIDTVHLEVPEDFEGDPCDALNWQISYRLADGTTVQTDGWGDGNGSVDGDDDDDDDETGGETDGWESGSGGDGAATGTDGGCSCRSSSTPSGAWLALLLLGLRRRTRTRHRHA